MAWTHGYYEERHRDALYPGRRFTMHSEVTRRGLLDMQVCVPKDWADEAIVEFAERENPCGTINGWFIRRQGSEYLSGSDERVQCSEHRDNVHIMLEC